MRRGQDHVLQLPDDPGRSRRRPRDVQSQSDPRSSVEASVRRAKRAADPVRARRVARSVVLGRTLSRLFCRERIRRPRAQPSRSRRKRWTSRFAASSDSRLRRRCRGRGGDAARDARLDRAFDGRICRTRSILKRDRPQQPSSWRAFRQPAHGRCSRDWFMIDRSTSSSGMRRSAFIGSFRTRRKRTSFFSRRRCRGRKSFAITASFRTNLC